MKKYIVETQECLNSDLKKFELTVLSSYTQR